MNGESGRGGAMGSSVSSVSPSVWPVRRCPVCGSTMGEERWFKEDEEVVEYTCFKCGYRLKFHYFKRAKKEWFPVTWVESPRNA